MSKLDNKFLQEYSLETLRDVDVSSPDNNDVIQYDTLTQTWNKRPEPKYGLDFDFAERVGLEDVTGGAFVTYDSLTFNVSDTSNLNSYRINADFLWGHNSASNDIRVRILVNGVSVKELRMEPKDAGTDQRFQNNILYYANNLNTGNNTVDLQLRPASASRISRMYESIIEVWRVS